MRPVLRESSAVKGRERAAEIARGRATTKPQPRATVDTSPRWCLCGSPWNDGDGDCMRCGKPIQGRIR